MGGTRERVEVLIQGPGDEEDCFREPTPSPDDQRRGTPVGTKPVEMLCVCLSSRGAGGGRRLVVYSRVRSIQYHSLLGYSFVICYTNLQLSAAPRPDQPRIRKVACRELGLPPK